MATNSSHKKRIAVMTSGGDAPGMNGAVRAVVRQAIKMGCEAYAIYEGYAGLVKGGGLIKRMEWQDVRGWLSEGGTYIGTARCMEFYERPGRLQGAKNMILNGIDALIICGGDGSLTGADKFRAEWPGLLQELVEKKELTPEQVAPFKNLNICGLVGSIDNDMSGTDATIGAFSSLGQICQMVDKIEDTAGSHSRAFVIEVMGRHCGWLALMTGVATGADFVFIPEKPPASNWREDMLSIIATHRTAGKRRSIIIIAEGALDYDGNKITAKEVNDLLADKAKLGIDTRVSTLGHVQRGGKACAYDRMLSTLQGIEAVKAVLEATPETPTPFIGILANKIVRKPLVQAVIDTKEVAKAIQAHDFTKAMSLRDSEFSDYYECFMTTTTSTSDTSKLLPPERRMRIGIMHVGAPAGGMNAATRAAVAYCRSRGHTPVALHNSFSGLVRHHGDTSPRPSSVRDFEWLQVDDWASHGGSEIGTNRGLPSSVGTAKVAELIEKYQIDGLFLVGGFEAFNSLVELERERFNFHQLCIPMTILPATISNNVPGTEYSIGSDTCQNELLDHCDKNKKSAASSRRRIFVIETQGGNCGYAAMLGGLSVGAVAVYTPEEGVSLDMIAADIKYLKDSFKKDVGQSRAGRVLLINEHASKVYNAQLISDIISEESGGLCESRWSVPGHVLQGDVPTPMDRVRAVRLAMRCMQHIESFAGHSKSAITRDPLSCSVIGIKGSSVVFSSVKEVADKETDWANRRPKAAWWLWMKEMVDNMSGRWDYPKREEALKGETAKDFKRGLE